MRRLLPQSLTGQTIVVLLIGLVASHVVAMTIYSGDRGEALSLTEAEDLAERIAGTIHLLRGVPEEWRETVVAAADSRGFRVALRPDGGPPPPPEPRGLEGSVARYLAAQLDGIDAAHIVVRRAPWTDGLAPADRLDARESKRSGFERLEVAVRMEDGSWLGFAGRIPAPGTVWPGMAGVYILVVALAAMGLSVWVVTRVTTPLRAFAEAAERLGRDIGAAPLDARGPVEVARASRALNDMQARLKRLIENRTQMLAAISHDLRTPITLLRLRIELLEDEPERARMLATLDEMEAMVASVIAFTREASEAEGQRVVDLSALLASVCDDLADAGQPVACAAPERVLCACRPASLKRALTNLIDNAIKYGGGARVRLTPLAKAVELIVEDDGPGVPPDQLDKILLPFFRGEASRNRATGGVGLGLSIAQSVVHAHGGTLSLANRAAGGLQARIVLPR